jgi:hypothetical protein
VVLKLLTAVCTCIMEHLRKLDSLIINNLCLPLTVIVYKSLWDPSEQIKFLPLSFIVTLFIVKLKIHRALSNEILYCPSKSGLMLQTFCKHSEMFILSFPFFHTIANVSFFKMQVNVRFLPHSDGVPLARVSGLCKTTSGPEFKRNYIIKCTFEEKRTFKLWAYLITKHINYIVKMKLYSVWNRVKYRTNLIFKSTEF